MKKYKRPKNELPEGVSLHDSEITACKVKEKKIILEFGEGFSVLNSADEWERRGVRVVFKDIDHEYSCVRILRDKKFKEYDIKKFPKLLKKKSMSRFEIVDQYFGYNSIMLNGVLWRKGSFNTFQLEIHYTGDMIYKYE